LVLIAIGWMLMRKGILGYKTWYEQPVWSVGLIVTGIVMILAVSIPERLISRLAAKRKR